jgi:hypothetical protein
VTVLAGLWSDLPGRCLIEDQEGTSLGLGEVTGTSPLGQRLRSCRLRGARAVACGRPGVEEHQLAHPPDDRRAAGAPLLPTYKAAQETPGPDTRDGLF